MEETKAQMDRDAAIVSAAIVHDIAPVPFGPKTLKKTIKANTRKARLLLEETYAHHSKANAKVNLRVHDLLFVVPAPTHNIFGKAARRSIATISWLAGKPTALQQAIKIDDLVGVFKLFITSPEEFYAEVNTQGIEDMTELGATHTMENMVNALFGSLETIFANNK